MHVTSRARKVASIAAALAIGGATLVAAPATAQAAPTFAVTSFTGPTSITVPTQSTTYNFVLTFSGAAASGGVSYEDYGTDYSGSDAVRIDGVGSDSTNVYFNSPSSLTPGQPATFTLELDEYSTPGRYHLTAPISQWNSGDPVAQLVPAIDVNIIANPAITLAESSIYGSGKFSKKSKWTWQFFGPDYIAGASVKVYYKASGKKKYVKVASGRANSVGNTTFKGKKGAIRKKGSFYVLIGAVPYSPQVKSGVGKIGRV